MKKKRAMAASRDPGQDAINFVISDIVMMRITPDGFWIRGEQVPQDDKEAERVYNALKEFIVYNNLVKDY